MPDKQKITVDCSRDIRMYKRTHTLMFKTQMHSVFSKSANSSVKASNNGELLNNATMTSLQ